MSETNKDIAVAFYKAVTEGRVEDAFRLYAGTTYRQHNPLIEDGMEGLRKVATWLRDARFEIKRVFAATATTLSFTAFPRPVRQSPRRGGGGHLPPGRRQGRRALGRDPADPG